MLITAEFYPAIEQDQKIEIAIPLEKMVDSLQFRKSVGEQ
jgi:hypothetical protein